MAEYPNRQIRSGFFDLFVELEALLVGQCHRVEIHDDDPAALQACQFIVAVRFLSPSQAHVETVVDVLGARNAFEIGDQRFLKDEGAYEQLAMAPPTGQMDMGPAATLKINITDSPPDQRLPTIYYESYYYSVNDTVWDRTTFLLLSVLFQTTIGKVENVGIPITISK